MTRGRLAVIVVTAVVLLGLAGGYLVYARSASRAEVAGAEGVAAADPAAVLAAPHVVFRNSALGPDYGRLAAVTLADPGGPRAIFDIGCERSYATADAGVCVTAKRGVVQTYGVAMLGPNLQPTSSTELVGLPSRARMSADGSLVATTTFVTGHSYAQASFSTETIIRRDGRSLGNLETWDIEVDGHPLAAVDRNFWGVTFAADDDTFFVTGASGGTTWLMRGSLKAKRLTSLRTDAECPSLSPDGTKVAYKKRLGNKTPGVWRIAVLDLATGKETMTTDLRSVDDQVEWLDDNTLLYGMPRTGADATTTDIWAVPADGTGEAKIFIE
ncbi:MAG TPA: hypothetical protein VFN19_04435, partial [Candidatus Nanopelagicales bacterium]|nr:hypothetical protein [Candidatus Nanopelagicales bacterium]